MTDPCEGKYDIVPRLRDHTNRDDNDIAEAATYIERLRAERDALFVLTDRLTAEHDALRAERDEARRKLCIWYELHKRGDGTGTANEFGWDCFKQDKTMITQSQRDMRFLAYVREEVADEAKDKFFTVMFVADIMAALDRVIAERDEARREVCGLDADTTEDRIEYARQRGWDCFKEDGK
jgi:hypothetical protein